MSALTYATAQLLRVLPRRRVSRAAGLLADHRWSPPLGRAVVALYSRAYDVDLEDCAQTTWASFDSFFTRALRNGVRPVDTDPRAIVSPADGRIDSVERIGDDAKFLVKGHSYRIDELVGDVEEGRRYAGGHAAVIYLSPRDYHRVHAPVSGHISRVRSMPGDYYPVNAIGIRHVKNLFARNRRVAIAIDTPEHVGLGRVTVVMVAAIIVGRVTVTGIDAHDVPAGDHVFDPPRPIARGGEIGIFHLGSTAVLLLEKRAMDRCEVARGPVRYGQRLGAASPVHGAANAHDSSHTTGAG